MDFWESLRSASPRLDPPWNSIRFIPWDREADVAAALINLERALKATVELPPMAPEDMPPLGAGPWDAIESDPWGHILGSISNKFTTIEEYDPSIARVVLSQFVPNADGLLERVSIRWARIEFENKAMNISNWLKAHLRGQPERVEAQKFLQLVHEYWRRIPGRVAEELIIDTVSVHGEAAAPVLTELYASTDASDELKKAVNSMMPDARFISLPRWSAKIG